MTEISRPFEAQPYEDDLDFLQHAFEWIMALARAVGARRENQKATMVAEPSLLLAVPEGEDETGGSPWDSIEARLREAVEARSLGSREAGSPTALDHLVDDLDLGESERLALLLAAAGAFSTTLHEDIIEVTGMNWSFIAPCAEFCVAMTQNDSLALRMEIRQALGPKGTLVREGLIDSTYCEDDLPAEFWQANIRLTNKGLALLTGQAEIRADQMPCPSCARPAKAAQGA